MNVPARFVQVEWASQLSVLSMHSSMSLHASDVAVYPFLHVHAPLTRCGLFAGQLVHSAAPGPEHVVQPTSHARHV